MLVICSILACYLQQASVYGMEWKSICRLLLLHLCPAAVGPVTISCIALVALVLSSGDQGLIDVALLVCNGRSIMFVYCFVLVDVACVFVC